MRLGREERQELVGYLSGEGLSTRAIAPILAVDRKTVERDIRGGANVPPAIPRDDAPEYGDYKLPSITGLDGKTSAHPVAVARDGVSQADPIGGDHTTRESFAIDRSKRVLRYPGQGNRRSVRA